MSDLAHVHWWSEPSARRPLMIAAFEGWNDAGDAASTTVTYLQSLWPAEPFAEIEAEPFYEFSTTRPRVELDDEGFRRIVWPTTTASLAHVPGADRDIVFVTGVEPQLRWRTFCEQLLGIAKALGVDSVITLGALLADVPHSRDVPVYGATDDPSLQWIDQGIEVSSSAYEGPTGIVGVLANACLYAGLYSTSLWAAVPSYVPSAPSPKAALALVRRLTTLLGVAVTATDLEIAAAAYERQVDSLVEEDEETEEYVAELEAHYDSETDDEPAAADQLVEEVERFLRDQRD